MPRPSESSFSRRHLLGAGVAGLAAAPMLGARSDAEGPGGRPLRVAFLTDVHVQAEKQGEQGFAACLAHVQSRPDPPDLVVFGGDNLMNVDGDGGRERAPAQLACWNRVVSGDLTTPHRTVIGNHDILAMDPVDGRRWACDAFGLDRGHYHWDQGGWRFIVLDSTSPNVLRGGEGGYKGLLDEAQFDWLDRTLRDTPKDVPVCVLSHIPILSACVFFDGENEKTGDWSVPGAWMHLDARRLKDRFHRHGNVKLCLSGHLHLAEIVDYLGVRYACGGAVSGGWWGGPYHEFEPGYLLVDLHADGRTDVAFETFGWTPKEDGAPTS